VEWSETDVQHFEEKKNLMPKTAKKRLEISKSKQNFGSVGLQWKRGGWQWLWTSHAQSESAVGRQSRQCCESSY
jgi:hypothetical protein